MRAYLSVKSHKAIRSTAPAIGRKEIDTMKITKSALLSIAATALAVLMLAGCAEPSQPMTGTDAVNPGDSAKSQEQTTEAEKTSGAARLAMGENGYIKGSVADYDITFEINGMKFTAAEYLKGTDECLLKLHDLLADGAMRNDSNIDGIKDGSAKGENIGTVGVFLDYPFDANFSYDLDSGNYKLITFMAWYGGVVYGVSNVLEAAPAEYYTVDFELDGIKLGDDLSKVTERYGTPTSVAYSSSDGLPVENKEDAVAQDYYYYFEGDGDIAFTATADGEIIRIFCTVNSIGMDDDRALYGDGTSN